MSDNSTTFLKLLALLLLPPIFVFMLHPFMYIEAFCVLMDICIIHLNLIGFPLYYAEVIKRFVIMRKIDTRWNTFLLIVCYCISFLSQCLNILIYYSSYLRVRGETASLIDETAWMFLFITFVSHTLLLARVAAAYEKAEN